MASSSAPCQPNAFSASPADGKRPGVAACSVGVISGVMSAAADAVGLIGVRGTLVGHSIRKVLGPAQQQTRLEGGPEPQFAAMSFTARSWDSLLDPIRGRPCPRRTLSNLSSMIYSLFNKCAL